MAHLLDKENLRWVIKGMTKNPEGVEGLDQTEDWKAYYRVHITTSGNPHFATFKLAWKETNGKAIRLLMAYSDGTRAKEIERMETDGKTAAEIWTALETKYNKKDTNRQSKDWQKIMGLVIPKNASHQGALKVWDELQQVAHRIQMNKPKIEDLLGVIALRVGSLRHPTICDSFAVKKEDFTLEEVAQACIGASERVENVKKLVAGMVGEGETKALVSKARRPGSHQSRGKSNHGKKTSSKAKRKSSNCSHCDRPGHNEDGCWMKHPELKPEWAKRGRGSDKNKDTGHENKRRKMSVGEKNGE